MLNHRASYFLRGLIVGFSIAAPVGPIGLLCIRRSLTAGRLAGFVSGLGAATADGVYGLVAAFGLTAVSGLLLGQRAMMQALGAVYLAWLGVQMIRKAPAPIRSEREGATAAGLLKDYASIFFLTITNPMTILSFLAIFAGVGLEGTNASTALSAILVAGVFLGSLAWWLILSFSVGSLRGKLDEAHLRWVNRISGAILLAFVIFIIISEVNRHG